MTNQERQEINEFLAERLFGWSWIDGILWDEKMNCNIIPDYIENYQPVLEKLVDIALLDMKRLLGGWVVSITNLGTPMNGDERDFDNNTWFAVESGFCDTLGAAICRAAVEYLKAREDE